MFETTNQYHILTSFINLTMAKTRVVHGYPPFSDSQEYKYPAVHSYEPLPMYKGDLPIQKGGFPYIYIIYIHNIILYHIQSYTVILRTNPVVCPDCNIEDSLLSNMRREIAENTAYTQCFLLSDSEFSGF